MPDRLALGGASPSGRQASADAATSARLRAAAVRPAAAALGVAAPGSASASRGRVAWADWPAASACPAAAPAIRARRRSPRNPPRASAGSDAPTGCAAASRYGAVSQPFLSTPWRRARLVPLGSCLALSRSPHVPTPCPEARRPFAAAIALLNYGQPWR